MSLSTQSVFPGRLEAAYRRELERLIQETAIAKIWRKDPSLWTSDAGHAQVITNRLGWVSVLDEMRAQVPRLTEFARQVERAGLRDILLLGMGGSSLAPEVFALTFPRPPDSGRFHLLDSTDPGAVLAAERAVVLRRTLLIVASKSGKTVETLSQYFYFHRRLYLNRISPQGPSFIAITDEGSHLARLATENDFRETFLNPADIGGRYSALSYFGLVPAALCGVDLVPVLDSAMQMREACAPSAAAETNIALQLGAFMGAAAKESSDKLFLVATPALVPLGNWIEQLVAESTGKEGKGVVPVAGPGIPPREVLAEGSAVAALRLEGDDSAALDAALEQLKSRGVPVVEIHLPDRAALGGEFFKWEVATAAAGAVLGIDPFDEPNVQESKDNTARLLENFQTSGEMPAGKSLLSESGIEVYADDARGKKLSTPRLSELFRAFFSERRPGDYLALLAYVERDDASARQLELLRTRLAEHLCLSVLLGYGPRYMHSIGQLYKGGPASGMFLVITAAHAADIPIPGAEYTFGQLEMAQALGDMESLARRGKPALRVHLTRGAAAGLVELRRTIEHTLAAMRPAAG